MTNHLFYRQDPTLTHSFTISTSRSLVDETKLHGLNYHAFQNINEIDSFIL